ncbi:hypothetical protein AVDCRST_MAG84-2125 [uncultured Microcoleus sp.]|uniref:Uncharacterized protein n=1 Tax=uncultured Microcoleus sp. TaxID=259945 RepID=A0A6J4LMK6_9CYAN|nr:hypothetical protein AVDCRST_MAG84-2125 [uncultured Microcoleus sp.]
MIASIAVSIEPCAVACLIFEVMFVEMLFTLFFFYPCFEMLSFIDT